MKKYLLVGIILTIILSSCSNNSTEPEEVETELPMPNDLYEIDIKYSAFDSGTSSLRDGMEYYFLSTGWVKEIVQTGDDIAVEIEDYNFKQLGETDQYVVTFELKILKPNTFAYDVVKEDFFKYNFEITEDLKTAVSNQDRSLLGEFIEATTTTIAEGSSAIGNKKIEVAAKSLAKAFIAVENIFGYFERDDYAQSYETIVIASYVVATTQAWVYELEQDDIISGQ